MVKYDSSRCPDCVREKVNTPLVNGDSRRVVLPAEFVAIVEDENRIFVAEGRGFEAEEVDVAERVYARVDEFRNIIARQQQEPGGDEEALAGDVDEAEEDVEMADAEEAGPSGLALGVEGLSCAVAGNVGGDAQRLHVSPPRRRRSTADRAQEESEGVPRKRTRSDATAVTVSLQPAIQPLAAVEEEAGSSAGSSGVVPVVAAIRKRKGSVSALGEEKKRKGK